MCNFPGFHQDLLENSPSLLCPDSKEQASFVLSEKERRLYFTAAAQETYTALQRAKKIENCRVVPNSFHGLENDYSIGPFSYSVYGLSYMDKHVEIYDAKTWGKSRVADVLTNLNLYFTKNNMSKLDAFVACVESITRRGATPVIPLGTGYLRALHDDPLFAANVYKLFV